MQFRIIAQALMSDETTDSYEWENIKKALCEKMNNSFADFYSAFWKFRNAETPDTFNYYWREMVTNYPTALEYLKRQLYKQCKAWARGFTTMLFTLGIESTSFVESQNACIKCVFENSNTSLCELGKHEDIEDEMDSVSICAKFLLQQLDYSSIVEVWNISQVTWIPKEYCQNVVAEGDHFGQQFVDSIIENENRKNKSTSYNWNQPFYDTNEQENNTNEGFANELLFYRKQTNEKETDEETYKETDEEIDEEME
ncbi:hypothetical protein C2G38_2221244 [Gigaspora rosea]|uniref:Uncharacterized protein n=1 Tax=Gigaspora rosea TaxID=44941 RepID=A0A397U5B7_9GLOM|nr:hypothetical protein C2G38_2221244 [Gigaspora rosea]